MRRGSNSQRSAYHERIIHCHKTRTRVSCPDHRFEHRRRDSAVAGAWDLGRLLMVLGLAADQKVALPLVELRKLAHSPVESGQVAARCGKFALETRHAFVVGRNGRKMGVVDVLSEPFLERRLAAPRRPELCIGFAQGCERLRACLRAAPPAARRRHRGCADRPGSLSIAGSPRDSAIAARGEQTNPVRAPAV